MEKVKKNKGSNTIVKDGIMLTLVKTVTLVSSIIQTMILARMLSLSEYGNYSQLLIIVSITTIICGLGLSNAVNYFYNVHEKQEDKEREINSILTITIISGVLAALVCFLCKGGIAGYFSNEKLSGLIIYIIFKPMLDNIVALYQPLYISLKSTKVIAIRNFLVSVLKTILIPISYWITKSLIWIFIVQIILDILQVIYFTIDLKKRNFKIKIKFPTIESLKKILKYSLPLALALMLGNLFKESDKLIIARLMDKESLAIYTNMSKQLPFEFIATSFASVITPLIVTLYKTDKVKTSKIWSKYLEFSYLVTWILCAGTIVCGKELLLLLYSEKYLAGLSIFIIYLLTEFFRFTYFGLIPSACGKTKIILISSASALVLNIILNIVFYKIFGFIGPALASLLSVIMIGAMQFVYSCKLLEQRIIDIIKIKHMIMFIIQLIVVGMMMFGLKQALYRIYDNYFIILILIYGLNCIINLGLRYKNIMTTMKEMRE